MTSATTWPLFCSLLAVSIPLVLGCAALLVTRSAPFRSATIASWFAAGLALIASAGGAWAAHSLELDGWLPAGLSAIEGWVRMDVVTCVMLILVCTIAIVIVRYSRTYLCGDAGQARYARALLAALTAVTVLVISSNLAVIALAWMATSLALHELLTFYRYRPQALVAAHKKFLLSRLADVSLAASLTLIALEVGSLDLEVVHGFARAQPSLPFSLQVAALLLVVAVSLKSAQLPFHGWLTQVMEAPTPVSALLHAGVVNIGGLVMIRLAPLMIEAPIAQGLLIAIGMTTAVIASLVMTTRVSVKVALAWSTCAQMGFMLVQCGLGAWHLALLHLLAHSLYKAHAFLSSGTAVDAWKAQALATRGSRTSLTSVGWASAAVLAGLGAAAAAAATLGGPDLRSDMTLAPLMVLLGLSLAPVVARGARGGWRTARQVALRCAGVSVLYFAWHAAFARILPPTAGSATPPLAWGLVVAGFALLFAVQVLLQARPDGRLAQALQPRLFAGLYLDEIFTRMTFRLWPPRPTPTPTTSSVRISPALEARS